MATRKEVRQIMASSKVQKQVKQLIDIIGRRHGSRDRKLRWQVKRFMRTVIMRALTNPDPPEVTSSKDEWQIWRWVVGVETLDMTELVREWDGFFTERWPDTVQRSPEVIKIGLSQTARTVANIARSHHATTTTPS